MDEAEKMKAISRAINETDLRQSDTLITAKELALSFEEQGDRDWALGEIAKGLAVLGKWDEAEETARCITLADEKADTLVAIARRMLATHEVPRALSSLLAAEDAATRGETNWVWQRAFSLLGIARALMEASDKDGALRLWEESVHVALAGQRIPSHDSEECEGVLKDVATDLMKIGYLEKARQVAQMIRHPVKRQRALETIAAISRSS